MEMNLMPAYIICGEHWKLMKRQEVKMDEIHLVSSLIT